MSDKNEWTQDELLGTLIQLLLACPHSVYIQKLCAGTWARDCPGLCEFLGLPISHNNHLPALKTVGTVWRCRIGRYGKWYYGHDITDAIRSALNDADGDEDSGGKNGI